MRPHKGWKNRNQNKIPSKCNDVVAGKVVTKTNFPPDAAAIDAGKIGCDILANISDCQSTFTVGARNKGQVRR